MKHVPFLRIARGQQINTANAFFLQRRAKFSEGIGKRKLFMKTNSQPKKICSRPSLSRLRIAAAGTLVLAAAGLAATSLQPPKLPWGVPTVKVGNNPTTPFVVQATHTIYVTNPGDGTVSVIDGNKCNSTKTSGCSPIATLTIGPTGGFAFDPTTGTLYAPIGGGSENTIAVVNANTCNATKTSGCGQTPATITVPGATFNDAVGQGMNVVLDTATHTLYIGDANEGPVSFINTATCNGTNTSGCSQTPVATATNGDTLTIDPANHTVYVTDFVDGTLSVFNGATCNAGNTSGCGQTAGPFVGPGSGVPGVVDDSTHTVYMALGGSGALDHVAMIDGSTCNGTVSSGCANTPPMVQVGDNPTGLVIDPTTRTLYVVNQESASISVINTATCNATNQSGCTPTPLPALAIGVDAAAVDVDLRTHTLYAPSQDINNVWVLNAATCNATHTSGCTRFEPTTTVGIGPVDVAENPNTQTLYEANQVDNTVSVIDTTACNKNHLAGCNQSWPTINVGNVPRRVAINKTTNTIYVGNNGDGTLSVINGATCNAKTTSSCAQPQPTTMVGNSPEQLVVDEATNTIYVTNTGDNTVSIVSGVHCNGTDMSRCNHTWPTFPVGSSPQALAFNPINRTLYVANRGDNTVSVINTSHCKRGDHTDCTVKATVPVGNGPRAIGIVLDKNTVFVGNRNDLTVSIFDGSTCNGSDISGCPNVPPPAVLVGAFPSTAGNGSNILGRSIAVDQEKHIVYVPIIGDSDVATLDANACRAGHVDACHVKIVHERMGGFSVIATVDESTETVYVANDTDGTVSLFPSHH